MVAKPERAQADSCNLERRYWATIGPQEAQYIPGPLLRKGENELILLETESSAADTTGLRFVPRYRCLGVTRRRMLGCLDTSAQAWRGQ